jgi:hypothetical protein
MKETHMGTRSKKPVSLSEILSALDSGEVLDLDGQVVKSPLILSAEELARVAGGAIIRPTTYSGADPLTCGGSADDCGCW